MLGQAKTRLLTFAAVVAVLSTPDSRLAPGPHSAIRISGAFGLLAEANAQTADASEDGEEQVQVPASAGTEGEGVPVPGGLRDGVLPPESPARGGAGNRRPGGFNPGASRMRSRRGRSFREGGGSWPESESRRPEGRASSGNGSREPRPPAVDQPEPEPSVPERALSGPTNNFAKSDFAFYRIISERNIFDPNRSPRSRFRSEQRRPVRAETITLVGTMSYDKGSYAFFDGSSTQYRKVLENGKKIAGFVIGEVGPNSITLSSGTNRYELRIGMELRREEGEWQVVGGQAKLAEPNRESQSSPDAEKTSGAESDIEKRLMQRRAEELK